MASYTRNEQAVAKARERIDARQYVLNSDDPYDDLATLEEGRASLRRDGYRFELVDLREWRRDRDGLRSLLSRFDAFLLTGGNPYHLRSLMKTSGADAMITELVRQGAVYAGASAAAVVVGPTLRHFDELDDPGAAEELIWEGLGLTDIVVAPHVNNRTSARAVGNPGTSASRTATPCNA